MPWTRGKPKVKFVSDVGEITHPIRDLPAGGGLPEAEDLEAGYMMSCLGSDEDEDEAGVDGLSNLGRDRHIGPLVVGTWAWVPHLTTRTPWPPSPRLSRLKYIQHPVNLYCQIK